MGIRKAWCDKNGDCLAGWHIVAFTDCTHYKPLSSGGDCLHRGIRRCRGSRGNMVKVPTCNCAAARREVAACVKKPKEEHRWAGGRQEIPVTVIWPDGRRETYATKAGAAAATGMTKLTVRWYVAKGLVNKDGVRFERARAA